MKIKIALLSIKISFQLVHLILAAILFLLITYFFGNLLLSAGLLGNDSANGFSFVIWLDKFYPKVPLWYPLQGTGVSFVQGYQVFPHLVVVWLHHYSNLSLIQSFKLLSFLTVYFSALGVYFLGWARFKSQTLGLIAGVFLLLSPVTWVWTTQAGFFAAAFSLMFFAPAFLFVDWYFDYVYSNVHNRARKIIFFLAIIFLSLSLLAHFTTFMAMAITSVIYYLIFAVIRKKDKFSYLVSTAFGGIKVYGTSLLISAFWFVPFYLYNKNASWDGSGQANPDLFPPINLASFLSIPGIDAPRGGAGIWSFSFPIFVWVLALLAIPLAVFYSKRIFSLGVAAAFIFYGSIFLEVYRLAYKFSPFLASGFSPRVFWISYNFLGPLLAAFSLWFIPKLILVKLPKTIWKRERYNPILKFVLINFALVITFLLTIYIVFNFKQIGKNINYPGAHYGAIYLYGQQMDLRDIWLRKIACRDPKTPQKYCDSLGKVDQIKPENWPPVTFSNGAFPAIDLENMAQLKKNLPVNETENERVEISPLSYGSLLSRLPIFRQDLSTINVYTFQLSLNHAFWAAAQGVFYHEDGLNLYQNPKVLTEFDKLFGINYVVLGEKEPTSKYVKEGWTLKNITGGSVLATPPESFQLFELDNKPAILVVGAEKYEPYWTSFRVGVQGGLSFDKQYLVMGEPNIDDYSLKDLQKYKVLILHAYKYHSKKNAFKLVSDYVSAGGNVFIDTGWQYTVPDWKTEEALDFLPVGKLDWKYLATDGKFKTEDKTVLSQNDLDKFSPLTSGGASWGVSSPSEIKSWGKPILSYNGTPLIVQGVIGQGKIIWSGTNILSHALITDNKTEMTFISNLLISLLGKNSISKVPATMDPRTWPDKVELTVGEDAAANSNLYFREAFSPNWQGYVKSSGKNTNIKISRAGAGMIFAKLPSLQVGDKIILEYKNTFLENFALIVSFFTAFFILTFLLDGLFLKERLLGPLKSKFGIRVKKPQLRVSKKWREEEDEEDS